MNSFVEMRHILDVYEIDLNIFGKYDMYIPKPFKDRGLIEVNITGYDFYVFEVKTFVNDEFHMFVIYVDKPELVAQELNGYEITYYEKELVYDFLTTRWKKIKRIFGSRCPDYRQLQNKENTPCYFERYWDEEQEIHYSVTTPGEEYERGLWTGITFIPTYREQEILSVTFFHRDDKDQFKDDNFCWTLVSIEKPEIIYKKNKNFKITESMKEALYDMANKYWDYLMRRAFDIYSDDSTIDVLNCSKSRKDTSNVRYPKKAPDYRLLEDV